MAEPTAPKPPRKSTERRVHDDRIHERFAKVVVRTILALSLALSGVAVASHVGGVVAPYLILGKKLSEAQQKKLEEDLAQILKEKEGLDPFGKFARWWGKVTSNLPEFLEKNEVTLRLNIERAKKLKEFRDVLEYVLYWVFASIISLYMVGPTYRFTSSLLEKGSIRRKRSEMIGVLNEHDQQIQDLTEVIAELKSKMDLTDANNVKVAKILEDVLELLKKINQDVKAKGDDAPVEDGDKDRVLGLIDRLKGLPKE